MKKIICLLLCLVTILFATGCDYSVPTPMEYPDYTFETEPDATQLRKTAVQALRNTLSIQWYTTKEIAYRKSGPLSFKNFAFARNKTYGGMFYSGAYSGIFQYFEFYNTDTGCLEYPGSNEELKVDLGTSCADAVLWAWSSVCNSIEGGFYPVLMVPANGYIPVGNYTFRKEITSYNELPTYAIIDDNPKDVIMDAYAKALPADALVSTPDNHAMMVLEEPFVVYSDDGSIDTAASYIVIQDQRGGDQTSTIAVVDNLEIPYSGRLSAQYTFDTLYEKGYIPLTTAEFIGEKPYDKAVVTASAPKCNDMDALADITIESNYPLAVVNIISVGKSGQETVLKRKLFNAASMYGVPRSFKISDMDNYDSLSPSDGTTVKIEVVVSTGERFYPIEFTT